MNINYKVWLNSLFVQNMFPFSKCLFSAIVIRFKIFLTIDTILILTYLTLIYNSYQITRALRNTSNGRRETFSDNP